ncbi:MAG: TrkH family potassium uptake protein [Planctomycetota bacterium]|nr:TrkH family potassium uptake protein [Planctomycetota bacterium]
MNLHAVLHLLGKVLLLLAVFLLVPAGVALVWAEHESWAACLRSSLVAGVLGIGLVHLVSRQDLDQTSGRIPGVLALARNRRILAVTGVLALFLLLVPWAVSDAVRRLVSLLPELGSLTPEGLLVVLEALVLLLLGAGLVHQLRHDRRRDELGQKEFYRREGLAVVGLAWTVAGLIGALPFLFSGAIPGFIDAFFESVSGFTTTGSTILSAEGIDGLSRSIAFWRSFTHWLGGIGIVLVFVVLFPAGGRSLFRSEVPGVSREAVRQRVRDSGMGLLRVYISLTVLQIVLYMVVGLDLYESAVHAFGTLATGGFSTHSESMAYFRSPMVEGVTIVFMFLAGINFAVYDTTLRLGPKQGWAMAWRSSEVRLYTGVIVGSAAVIALVLWFWGGSNGAVGSELPDYSRLSTAVRDSSFVVVSVQTSTGFGTADFDQWPEFTRMLLMGLAFIGACAGSTGGGLKVVRFMVLAKASLRSFQVFARPRAKLFVRMNGQPLDEELVSGIIGYFGMWCLIAGAATLALAAMNIDPVTATTSVLATLNNIGPGLSMVGPTESFGWMPDLGKLLCSILMVIGRLEFYAVVVLFLPRFWRI